MAQEIKNRRGNLVISIPDGVVLMPPDPTVSSDGPTLSNTNTSLFQIGRDVLDYGLEIAENLHWLMENFANNVAPQNPVDGQCWWDLSNPSIPAMRVYNSGTGGWGSLVKLSTDSAPTLSADLNANGRKISNLLNPVSAQDAATKQYVDNAVASGGGGGGGTFLSLSDTPASYTGQTNKLVRVNSTSTGLEFYKLKFSDLDGVPGSFTGQAGKFLRVNSAASAIEYVNINISNVDWTGAVTINAQGTKIGNIATPTSGQDAATKSYVDSLVSVATGGVLPSSDGIIVKAGSSTIGRSVVAGNDGVLITNGNGVSGNITINHKSSSAVSSSNSGNTFIQSIGLDSYGHIQSLSTGSINVISSIGYTPLNKAGDMMQGALTLLPGINNGLRFPPDPFGGAGDLVTITLESAGGDASGTYGSGERQRLRFRVANDAGNNTVDDKAEFIVPDNASLLVNNNVVWNAGYQGPGTGMNSDLLDGYDWGSGQDVNFGTVNAHTNGSGTNGGIRVFAASSSQTSIIQFLSASGSQLGFLHVGSDGKLNYTNSQVWTAGNQGPGTGMNADLLDGHHASDFVLTTDLAPAIATSIPRYQVYNDIGVNYYAPSQFSRGRRGDLPSYGSINVRSVNDDYYISKLFEMKINASSAVNVSAWLEDSDDTVYFYLNGTLVTSSSGSGYKNYAFTWSFAQGLNLVQIVFNNSGGHETGLNYWCNYFDSSPALTYAGP